MAEAQKSPLFLVKAAVARTAFEKLCNAKVHRTLPGYLCLKRTAREQARTRDLKPNFKALFDDFLLVKGAPERSPYVVPFSEGRGERWSPFFNKNVAGSYAPGSFRDVSAFRRVVDISGSGRNATFSLLPDHARLALTHLQFDKPLGVCALAVFLFRDYGLHMPFASIDGVLGIFRNEFGYREEVPNEAAEFKLLFTDDRAAFPPQSFQDVGE